MFRRTIGAAALALALVGVQADGAGTQQLPPSPGDDWCWNCGDLNCLYGFGQGFVGCRDGGPNSGYCSVIPYRLCQVLFAQIAPSGFVVAEEVLAEANDGTQRGGCGNWIVGIQGDSDQGSISSVPPKVKI